MAQAPHTVCVVCAEGAETGVFTFKAPDPIKFDRGSGTRCCACGDDISGSTGYYTCRTLFDATCNGSCKTEDEP